MVVIKRWRSKINVVTRKCHSKIKYLKYLSRLKKWAFSSSFFLNSTSCTKPNRLQSGINLGELKSTKPCKNALYLCNARLTTV